MNINKLKTLFDQAIPGKWGTMDGLVIGKGALEPSIVICEVGLDPVGAGTKRLAATMELIVELHNALPEFLEAVELLKMAAHALAGTKTEKDSVEEERNNLVQAYINRWCERAGVV